MAVILIAEDEKEMQNILVDYMKRSGHTCIRADDGMDALLALKNNAVDLAILDIMMPHLDGFSVCRLAREANNLPILFLTAKSDEGDKLRGYEYGGGGDEALQSQDTACEGQRAASTLRQHFTGCAAGRRYCSVPVRTENDGQRRSGGVDTQRV